MTVKVHRSETNILPLCHATNHLLVCLFLQTGNIEYWTRPILPAGSRAFALLNLGTAVPRKVTFRLNHLGFDNTSGYNVTEVFDNKYIGVFKPENALSVMVNPSGVFFGKAVALSP